jgi:hypothetical protein
VSADDWYQRRRNDAEGEFFRKVADQGPRKGAGGSTRQGIYCLTASGKLLAYKNAQNPDVMREVLRQGLAAWRKLPAEERKPAAVKIDDLGKADARYTRTPPDGGAIVTVHTRILDADAKSGFTQGTCEFPGGDRSARDHLWLTRDDVRSLVPDAPKVGERFPLPERLARRLARFHFVDNTRGEPPFWTAEEVRKLTAMLIITEVTEKTVAMRLEGAALLATDAEPAKSGRGYDVRFGGEIRLDRAKKTLDRFEISAVGDHWGKGTYTPGARPGRTPLGIAFELSRGDKPGDRVPPQAAREWGAYVGR